MKVLNTACTIFIALTLLAAGLQRSVFAQTTSQTPPCLDGYPYPANLIPANVCASMNAVLKQIDAVEQQTLQQAQAIPVNPGTRLIRIRALGKLLLYDRSYSVNRNEACTSCHTKDTGFTGPISDLNLTTVDYPGSVRYRFGSRKPKSYAYSPFSQILHLDPNSQQFYGGNFWDQRASGWQLQNPSSQQAQEPPVDALELGFPDSACVVYRLSQAPYLPIFKSIWGITITGIKFPPDTEQTCSTPTQGPSDPSFPGNVPLDDFSRSLSDTVFEQFAMSIAADEAGPDVSPFNSKFDFAITHPNQQVLSVGELAGWQLFDGKGKCNLCHLDSLTPFRNGQPNVSPALVGETEPLFTDFAAFNLGIPKNPDLPYLYADKPDQFGVTPNTQGLSFIDFGLGAFLSDAQGVGAINPENLWAALEPANNGKFQTATTRNVDKRPSPDFVKSYFHNGYMKSLKEVVHFYNTRDVLPKCPSPLTDPNAPEVGKSCWPAPEVTQNLNQQIGNLGLTDQEENQIVMFMQTLSDGFAPPPQ
ncbi:MAG: cytochrome c peroxidase [Bryobacteraceae bacterium]